MRGRRAALAAAAAAAAAQAPVDEYDVAIAGGGYGGLSAGATLAMHGKKVLIVEKQDHIGGAARYFNLTGSDGFVYKVEGSLSVLPSPGKTTPLGPDYWNLFKQIGLDVQQVPRDLVHRLVLDKGGSSKAGFKEWNLWTDPQRLISEITSKGFPDAGDNISKLIDFSSKVMNYTAAISSLPYITDPVQKLKLEAWLAANVATFAEVETESVGSMLRRWIDDPELLTIIAPPPLYIGVPPESLASIIYAEMAGSWWDLGMSYPSGGSGTMARALADYIEAHGGKIMLNAEVTGLLTEPTDDTTCSAKAADGKCRKATGLRATQKGVGEVTVRTAATISDINTPRTIELAGDDAWPPAYVDRIAKLNVSNPVFEVIVAVKNATCLEAWGGAPELMLVDSLDMYSLVADLQGGKLSMLSVNNFAEIDPDFCCGGRGSGRAVLMLTDTVPFELFPADPVERKKYSADLAQRMIDRTAAYTPGLREALDMEAMLVFDPYDLQEWMGTPKGTAMGFFPSVKAEVPKGPNPGIPEQNTPVLGLYQIGQFSFPGGGQPSVSISGQEAALSILAGKNMPAQQG